MEHNVLFKTPHGSHLYGLAHADSDEDFYTVVSKVKTARAKYAKQKIDGDTDSLVIDFGTWLWQLADGVPQAWEAAFSTAPLVDKIGPMRAGLHMTDACAPRYLRTITSFCMTQDPKRKRHGLRLALNMYDWQRAGRFNPTLTPNEVDWMTEQAKKDCDAVYAVAMSMALDRLPPRMVR